MTFAVLVLAAVLIVDAVWFLWFVQTEQPHQSVQLGLLTFFIMAFGFTLNLITTATPDQVFGATGACAAVLIVLVGITGENSHDQTQALKSTVAALKSTIVALNSTGAV